MRFVEHHQIVGRDIRVGERREHAIGSHRVEGDDHPIATRSREGIRTAPDLRSGHDSELQPEQGTQLAFPVADEPGRRDDQHAANTPAKEHLPHIEPRHDGLAGARVVGEQEAERLLQQHPLVDRDALVRERIDPGRLAREGSVELVPVGQPMRFRHQEDSGRIPCEVQRHGGSWAAGICDRARRGVPGRDRLLNFSQPVEGQGPRARLAGFPPMDRERSHRHPLCKLRLSQAHP